MSTRFIVIYSIADKIFTNDNFSDYAEALEYFEDDPEKNSILLKVELNSITNKISYELLGHHK